MGADCRRAGAPATQRPAQINTNARKMRPGGHKSATAAPRISGPLVGDWVERGCGSTMSRRGIDMRLAEMGGKIGSGAVTGVTDASAGRAGDAARAAAEVADADAFVFRLADAAEAA